MRKMAGFIRDRRGAVAMVAALTLPVIAGFAALAIDIGHIVSLQARLQATADAAGLAAAIAAQDDQDATPYAAVEYASMNMSAELADGTNHKVWILRRADMEIVGSFGRGGRQVGQMLSGSSR